MSAGIAYAKKFNEHLARCNRERMTPNELQLIAEIASADHVCTLLAYGQCSACQSYISTRYGRFSIIRIDNLLFDYMSELRATQTVANAFVSTHQMHTPEMLRPGNPQRLTKRDLDLQGLNEVTQKALEHTSEYEDCAREHLTDHTCPPCSKEHSENHVCATCTKDHLDRHTCKICTREHTVDHVCPPCEEKHLRDHRCPPCKLKHLTDHSCPKCTEPHTKDHKCPPCTKSHLENHQCPTCTEPHTKYHACPPCTEVHLKTHKCNPCTKPHLDTHKCQPCTESHTRDHRCPPCKEPHLSDHHCPPCSKPHTEPFPAFTTPKASLEPKPIEDDSDNESHITNAPSLTFRHRKEFESPSLTRGRQFPNNDPFAPEDDEDPYLPHLSRKNRLPPVEAPTDRTRHRRDHYQPETGETPSYTKQDDEASITSSTRRHHRREESTQPHRHHRRASSKAPPAPVPNPKPGFFNTLAMAAQSKKSRREDQPSSPKDERKHRRYDSHTANY